MSNGARTWRTSTGRSWRLPGAGWATRRLQPEKNSSSANPILPGQPCGYGSSNGSQRYALEAESTTGFVAFQIADGTTLVSAAGWVFLPASPYVHFWPCAGYRDTAPAGHVISFDCHGISLNRLDVAPLAGLENLDCSFNRLTELPLTGLTDLETLDADNKQLTSLEIRDLHALRALDCTNNRTAKLDLSGLAALEILDFSGNPIAPLSLDGCTALQEAKGRGTSSA